MRRRRAVGGQGLDHCFGGYLQNNNALTCGFLWLNGLWTKPNWFESHLGHQLIGDFVPLGMHITHDCLIWLKSA